VYAVLISRVTEKAIQRRLFFPYREGSETLTVHRKPVPESISEKVFEDPHFRKVILCEETKSEFDDRIVEVVNKVRTYDIYMGVFEKDYKVVWGLESLGEIDKNPYGEVRYNETFRPHNCHLLVSTISKTPKRCSVCVLKRKNYQKRVLIKDTENKPHTRNTYLTREELLLKDKQKQKRLENARAQIVRLKMALETAISEEGVELNDEDSKDLCEILEKEQLSPTQELFIHEQIKIARAAKPCGRRWHPTILRFALLLKSTSTAAYRAVADSGLITLPSERTLFEYSHASEAKEGVTKEKLDRINRRLNEKYPKDYQRWFMFIMDEIHVNKKLVYQKSSGEMIGYVKMSDAERELSDFEAELKGDATPRPVLASKVLTFVVNGVANGICEVVASYPTHDSLDANVIYDKVWETIGALERSDIWIIGIVGDGAGPNRAFFALHPPLTVGSPVVFDTINLAAPHRPLYFFSDIPHLIKTIRNCFYKSGSTRRCTRLFTLNNEAIVRATIIRLYNEDKNQVIRRSYKLNANNVFLNAFSAMKVSLAAQVLSNTVATDLETRQWPGTKETVRFIRHVNDFFDMLNGCHTFECQRKANPNLDPYTDVNDVRFDKLLDFLKYLNDWKEQVQAKPGYTDSEKAKMILSQQTLDSIEMSVRSYIGCFKYLLSHGVPFLNARDFIQDKLERYYSKQRQMGGGNRNPTVALYLSNERKIAVHRDMNVRSSNVRGEKRAFEVDDSELPKRTKKKIKIRSVQMTVKLAMYLSFFCMLVSFEHCLFSNWQVHFLSGKKCIE